MKKLLVILVITMAFSGAFAQLSVTNQTQITLNKDDEISLIELGNKGFVVIQNTKSEESRKLRTWTFTLYNPQLEVVWTKSMDFEKQLYLLANNAYDGDLNLVYYIDNSNGTGIVDGQKVGDLTVMRITSDGEVSKKDIEFKDKIRLYRGNFINGAYYFDAAIKKEDAIMKIDFSTLALSSNRLNLPEHTDIFERTDDGKNTYFRVKTTKKKIPYDYLYTIDDGVVVEKTSLAQSNNEELLFLNILKPDSAHKFAFGLIEKEVLGERKKDDIVSYNYYLTNLNDNDIKSINKIDQKSSDLLNKKREVSVKNDIFLALFGSAIFLKGDAFLTSNCFRFQNKNVAVFDKYQEVWETYQEYVNHGQGYRWETRYRKIGYFFTNSVIYYFNDEGEIEWAKNFEYDIFSTHLKSKTCARPVNENTIALIGYFNNELSYKTISADGDVTEGNEKQKVVIKKKGKYTDVNRFDNSITNLYDNTYLVWGNDNDDKKDSEENKKKKKEEKRRKTTNITFKIVEFE